ncbi:lipid-A-disaccharide synthase [Catenovulum sp. 2E275]|uniref:lipid-A-disaccharide synthase n=1 Tax=Catenovulum sp. 2E275 TaxID=2980497 RepID=UPI0021CF83F1|nr:lipid-A-disaccharide synthase [Catenovulum sp. 2E275]MCU4675731.1 lipid-A-disaccharide synthase [Catenovulum sp. 2E275]
MTQKQLKIAIVAGEKSGDILAANLIQTLTARLNQAGISVAFEGVAGPLMQAQGCQTLFDMEELAVMGLVEVLGRLPRLLSIRKQLKNHWIQNPPDLMIGVDAPDFNLTLEKHLKQAGIKTVHYVSPSIWAWRQKRVFKVKAAADLVLALLPFEKAFYDKFDVPCRFVGHTLADQIPLQNDELAAKQALGLNPEQEYIAVLPGSRRSEVELLSPVFAQTCALLNQKYPHFKFITACVNDKRKAELQAAMAEFAPDVELIYVDNQSRDVMAASKAIMIASGTATLEAALIKRPMVACYKFKALSYFIFKRMVKVKFFSLPNLVADQAVIPELLQDQLTPQSLLAAIESVLKHSEQMQQSFTEIHQTLKQNAGEQAAQAIEELLNAN